MASFHVNEHVIPCQHIRGYRNAIRGSTRPLNLAIKEYIPRTPYGPPTEGVTIIAAHANGIPKETYEPLWEELSARLHGKLKAIWIADCSHQGASGVLNADLLGDDPNWFDHSRDLLGMVSHFRDSIKPPIVGVAHSMGCAQLVQLSIIHPRLFQGLVLIEPVIQKDFAPGPNAAFFTSYRPDFWNSYEDAREDFKKNKFYKSWDRRALDLYLQYGLKAAPPELFPDAKPGSVTLTTTKHQEAWSYLRPTFSAMPSGGGVDEKERLLTGDLDPIQASFLFHRSEPGIALQFLPLLQPSVLWVFGEKSYINRPDGREVKVSSTGTQARGSGGLDTGAVQVKVIERGGHLVPLEKISDTADIIAPYIGEQLVQFSREEDFWKSYDSGKSEKGMRVLSEQWMKEVRKKADAKRPVEGKTKL